MHSSIHPYIRTYTCKFWNLQTRSHTHTLDVKSPIYQTVLNSNTHLLAAATDAFSVYVIDIHTQRIVRQYRGHSNRITDMVCQ